MSRWLGVVATRGFVLSQTLAIAALIGALTAAVLWLAR